MCREICLILVSECISAVTKKCGRSGVISPLIYAGSKVVQLFNHRSLENIPSASPLQKFAAKLFILQNMENKDFLIHERLVKQEFGPKEFVVLTPNQKKIVHEASDLVRWLWRPEDAYARH